MPLQGASTGRVVLVDRRSTSINVKAIRLQRVAFIVSGSRRSRRRTKLESDSGGHSIEGTARKSALPSHESRNARRRHLGLSGDPPHRPTVDQDGGTQRVGGRDHP
jgi:hypothetical protein